MWLEVLKRVTEQLKLSIKGSDIEWLRMEQLSLEEQDQLREQVSEHVRSYKESQKMALGKAERMHTYIYIYKRDE